MVWSEGCFKGGSSAGCRSPRSLWTLYKHWWLVMLTGIWGLKTLACRTVEAVGCGTVPVVG